MSVGQAVWWAVWSWLLAHLSGVCFGWALRQTEPENGDE
jgi:hypothetical protein